MPMANEVYMAARAIGLVMVQTSNPSGRQLSINTTRATLLARQ